MTYNITDASLFHNDPTILSLLPTFPLAMIEPEQIYVKRVSVPIIVKLQNQLCKFVWRPAPGRKLGFIVLHKNRLIGIIFLASPVISLKVRDKHLNLNSNSSERGKELRCYYDMSVCVGVQPISWYWNIGKLLALLATTLGDFIKERYNDEFRGIVTTSLFGRSSQYNRIYKFLGYTKGYGHFHIQDGEYRKMLSWMRDNNIPVPSCSFGAGSNPRWRRIQAYKKAIKDNSITLFHGERRGVYYHPATSPEKRQEVIKYWYKRWGLPRYIRKKDEMSPY